MAELKNVRRAAEKAAADLLSTTLVTAAGELAVAHADRQEASRLLIEALAKADAILAAASEKADAITSTAEATDIERDGAYTATWNAAIGAGWTPAQLADMNYHKPQPGRARPAKTPKLSKRPSPRENTAPTSTPSRAALPIEPPSSIQQVQTEAAVA